MNLKKYVEETNAAFEAASPEEKRVMIAEDVIKRIEIKNLYAAKGSLIGEGAFYDINYNSSFKEAVNEQLDCRVCAKGALFCAFVGRVNEVNVRTALNGGNDVDDKFHTKLKELFSIEQLDLIEIAFENKCYLNKAKEIDRNKAYDFYSKYPDSANDRLIAICKNIIKNKGEFKP